MIPFSATGFVTAYNNLLMREGKICIAAFERYSASDWRRLEVETKRELSALAQECRELPLSESLLLQLDRAVDRVALDSTVKNTATLIMCGEIRQNISAELESWMFFSVSPADCHYYQAPEKFYGNTTFDAFPESEDDLRSAARMVAFGEWTACVFYLMRGVELALQKWAEQLNLDLKGGRIVDANWNDILNAADRKMKEVENLPKTEQREKDLRYFGATGSHFRGYKNAWRNRVAHGKQTYDERAARKTLESVDAFMRELAER